MLTDPKEMRFTSKGDVVDYVTGGIFPPLKDDFDKLMAKVRNPDPVGEETCRKIGQEIIIMESVMSEEERKILDDVLSKAYKNRIKNRNNIIKVAIVVGGALLFASIISTKNDRKNDRNVRRAVEMMVETGGTVTLDKDDIDTLKRVIENS